MNRCILGKRAERLAVRYLKRQGLTFIAQNVYARFGEIDLIMQDGETWVFVEVRARSSEKYGGAAHSMTYNKRGRLIRTAHYYLQYHCPNQLPPCRFDAVLIDSSLPRRAQLKQLAWIKGAFTA